jgi:hypothetical protein
VLRVGLDRPFPHNIHINIPPVGSPNSRLTKTRFWNERFDYLKESGDIDVL